jgi:WD40 repeat protein
MSGGLPGKLVSVAVVGLMLLAMNSPDQAADEAVPRIQPSAVVRPQPPKGSVGRDVLFGPDGKHLYAGWLSDPHSEKQKYALECWQIRQGGKTVEAVRIWQNQFEPLRAIAISPDGKYLAATPRNSKRGVLLIDPTSGKEMGTLRTEPSPNGYSLDPGEALAFSPDSRWLAGFFSYAYGRGFVQVWDVATRQTVRVWHFVEPRIGFCWPHSACFAFGPDGKTLVLFGPADYIVVWNVASKELKTWPSEFRPALPHGLGVAKVKDRAFWIFIGFIGEDREKIEAFGWPACPGSVQVRDEDGKVLYTRTAENWLTSVAVSPTGRWFATGELKVMRERGGFQAEDVIQRPTASAVYLWETETGKLLAILEGHQKGVNSVAVSPNGDWVAAAGGDGTVRLWKVPETIR